MNFGTIKHWNDEKGYGFITPDNGGNDVFLHIKSFKKRSHRPEIGEVVSYDATQGDKGRLRAVNVQFMKAESSASLSPKLIFYSLFAVIFLAFVSVATYIGKLPLFSAPLYFGASVITFFTYGIDKSKAQNDRWRIQESTLHLFSLVGGWPGAIFAQQIFNHKTTKESFRFEFWVTVFLNVAGFFWFTSPGAIDKTINFLDRFIK